MSISDFAVAAEKTSGQRPKVSIMIITYNHEKYIAQAIESVLMQKTNFRFEVNVIEDCSTDKTAAIILDYAKRFPDIVRPFLNKVNIGHKVTQKNAVRGLRTLKGEYIAILEGDDYWTSPDKLQKQVDYLDANPDYAICAHNTVKMYEDGHKEPHRFLYFGDQGDGTIEDVISLKMFFHTAGILYRNVFNGNPPRQYLSKWSCDIFVMISHAEFGKIHHLDEDMAIYRAHSGGRFSTMDPLAAWKFNVGGLQRYNAWLGFRHCRSFAKSIVKYCDCILTGATAEGLVELPILIRLKYTLIKYIYSALFYILETRNRINRAILLARLTINHYHARQSSAATQAFPELAAVGSMHPDRPSFFQQLRLKFLLVISNVLKTENVVVSLPHIIAFGPQSVERRHLFNIQPSGRSAIWMRAESLLPAQTVIVFRGKRLVTSVEKDVVTAEVPAGLTAKLGAIPIWLEVIDHHGISVSKPVYFNVLKTSEAVVASLPSA